MSSSVEGHGRQIGLVPGFVSFNREFYFFIISTSVAEKRFETGLK